MEFQQLKRMSKILSYFSHSFLFLVTLFWELPFVTSQNLICRGDFEGYPIHSAWFGDPYVFVPSNYSCWYTQTNGNMEIKKKSTPISSCVVELVSDTKYVLCQNIKLETQNKYQLNFTVLNTPKMSYSKILVNLNNQLLLSYVTFNQNNVSTATLNFQAPRLDNVLCFDSEFTIWDILYSFQVGPCLDNITLVKLANTSTTGSNSLSPPPTNAMNTTNTENVTANATDARANLTETNGTQLTNGTGLPNWTINLPSNTSLPSSNGQKEYIEFQINCTTEQVSQVKWEVTFVCVLPSGIGAYLPILRNCLQISIGDTATVPFQIMQYTEAFIRIKLPLSKNKLTLNLGSININIQQNAPVYLYNPIPLFYFYMDGIYMNVLKIGEKDASFMKYFSSVSKSLLENSKHIYQILKGNFFSYFLMNIINFWNLSLMYNLLNISIAPMFSKLSLHELTVIFFDLNSILEWLKSRISELQDLKIPEISSRELIEDEKNRFYWFGTYGLSSRFLENNFQTLLMITILFVKVGVLFIVRKLCFLPRWLRKKMPSKITLCRLFLIQLISLQVFVVVSAASNLIETGTNEFMGKINMSLQVMTLMACLIIFCLYFLVSTQARIRKSMRNLKKGRLKKSTFYRNVLKRIYKNEYYTQIHKSLQMTPILVIPFVILLNSTAFFLTVTSILIIVRIIWFYKVFSRLVLSLDEKIFTIINICFWVLLQVSYAVLFVYEQLVMKEYILEQSLAQSNYLLIKCCGYGSLIAVLFGGLFEVIRFIVQIVKQGYTAIRKTIKRWQKIKPMPKPNKNKETKAQHQVPIIGVVQIKENVKVNKIENKDRGIKSRRVRKQKIFEFYHKNQKQSEHKTGKIYFASQNINL